VRFPAGFHRRFDPDRAAAKERIRAGELGDVYLFRTSLRDMNPPNPAFLAGAGGVSRTSPSTTWTRRAG
jgi:predicted dehydrogenase